jgi:predicted proteasome-type protease
MRTPNKIYISKYIDMMYDEGLYKEFPYIGSCLDRTANIDYKDTYLKMLQDFSSKQDVRVVFVMRTIGKLKIKEAVLPMVNMLDTSNFRDDILEALDKYKDPTLLSYFERYKNDKDTDTRNAAKKGIKTIERLLQKNKKEY